MVTLSSLFTPSVGVCVSGKMNPGKTVTLQALRKKKEKWSQVGKIHIWY